MSTNLDRSLQEIISTKPKGGRVLKKRLRKGTSAPKSAKSSALASVVNGKKDKPLGANFDGTSKAILSNLPFDITEQQLRVRVYVRIPTNP